MSFVEVVQEFYSGYFRNDEMITKAQVWINRQWIVFI